MKRIFLIAYGLICLAAMDEIQAASQSSVSVKTYGQHIGGNIVYTYLVANNELTILRSLNIGCRCLDEGDPKVPDAGPRLTVFPINYDLGKELTSDGSYSAPTGWVGDVTQYEDTGYLSFQFSAPIDSGIRLTRGQTATFRITVPEEDSAYLKSYFSHYGRDANGKIKLFSFPMELIDKTPPSLSVTLTPALIWPPNGKLVKVIANVSAKDDYDPNPAIKLESITANQPLLPEEIDAQTGKDTRSFSLAARRHDQITTGRIYTVTYSATDASGNKAFATATVTVPHNQ